MKIRAYEPKDSEQLCAIHDAARMDELRLSAGQAAFLTLAQTAEGEGLFASELAVAELELERGELAGFVAFSRDESLGST